MSIRKALISAMLVVAVLATALVGALGVLSIRGSVVREAQERVNYNLNTFSVYYEGRLKRLAERIENSAKGISIDDRGLQTKLEQTKYELSLTVFNICDVDGQPIAGGYPRDKKALVPVSSDPVLRKALEGNPAWGTVCLDAERLRLEGGPALENAMVVYADRPGGEEATTSALFWWVAFPIKNIRGRVVALLYGGQALNFNYQMVDELRDMAFGTEKYRGKPLGTATIFLDGVRVATNVQGQHGGRAIGTFVSQEVRQEVLEEGESWHDRAWVVSAWYLSGYDPLRDPSGRIIGMLYVGLLEAPYNALQRSLIIKFLAPAIIVGVLAVLGALYMGRRITKPIRQLGEAASELARGDWGHDIAVPRSYEEIMHLGDTFREMQRAIAQRDHELRERNHALAETNKSLERVNRNYMETIGFVTHELKSPLAAIQTIGNILVEGFAGDVPEKARDLLGRIKRNCEELQDMVKNYFDLARVEKGELVANKSTIDFRQDVVDPILSEMGEPLSSRHIALRIACPEELRAEADPELMRIVLVNYLSNVVKYGRAGGEASLEVGRERDQIIVRVWNEGAGFKPEEAHLLFRKFSRISNTNTRDKRGSGLGLFLCKQILDLHSGRAWAESEPGQWARFCFSFPRE